MNATKPNKIQALSESLARTLPPGEYQDKEQKALRFYVSTTGVRSFGLYKWSPTAGKDGKGAPVRKSLGKWPDKRVEDVRRMARDLAGQLSDGKDIARKPVQREKTLEEVVADYGKKLKQENRARWDWVERTISFHASDWHPLPLSAITQEMIAVRQRRIAYGDADAKIKPRGLSAGANLVKAMRALYSFAEKEQNYMGKNVAKHVDRAPAKSRKRILSEPERAAILAALDLPRWLPHVRPYFRLLMLTGARRGNMSAARKQDFNLDKSVWVIPAPNAKGRVELTIHLRAEAVELLREQFAKHPESPWVFPTASGSSSGHIEEVWDVWQHILKAAGVADDITVHDLRRTYGSRLLNQDVPMEVVSKLMGHQNVATTAKHYAFVTDEAAAKHLNRADL